MLHSDVGNIGLSAVVALGRYSGGQLFTVSEEGCPLIHDVGGQVSLINGRAPHCVLPYAGFRLSAVAFLHSQTFRVDAQEACKLRNIGLDLPPPSMSVDQFPPAPCPSYQHAAFEYENLCHAVASIVEVEGEDESMPCAINVAPVQRTRWSGILRFLVGAACITRGSSVVVEGSSASRRGTTLHLDTSDSSVAVAECTTIGGYSTADAVRCV